MLYVEVGYMYGDDWSAFDYEKVRAVYPGTLPEEKPNTCPWYNERIRVTVEEANALTELGIKLTVLPLVGMMTVKMQDREKWDHSVRPQDIADGKAVQIAVPDMALMKIDEVEVIEDCCTRELQSMLDDGWRILAICPPNAQRRPDYILGRCKPKDPFGNPL